MFYDKAFIRQPRKALPSRFQNPAPASLLHHWQFEHPKICAHCVHIIGVWCIASKYSKETGGIFAMANSLTTLTRDISPPPVRKTSSGQQQALSSTNSRNLNGTSVEDGTVAQGDGPALAAIEAGKTQIRDHVEYLSKHLSPVSRPTPGPLLGIEDFQYLYRRNQNSHGRHFVVHQHDHPISGICAMHP